MIEHKFFMVSEKTYSDCYGAKYDVREVSYCTNDSGEGIFSGDCMHQLTGNGQFCGGRKKLQRWLTRQCDYSNDRYFLSEWRAKKYAAEMAEKSPLKKILVKTFPVGSVVNFMGSECKVLSQDGENLDLAYVDEPEHTFTTKFYTVY